MKADKTVKNNIVGIPFKKGDKRINRKGRPKGAGISITTEIKRELESIPKGHKASYLQLLIKQILKKAILDGDGDMIKQIWNYLDGKPKESIDITDRTELEMLKTKLKKLYGSD